MADKLGEAYVEIVAKDALGDGFDAARDKAEGLAGSMKSILGDIAAGISFGAVSQQIGDAVSKGGDLNETMSKIGVTFGSSAGVVLNMADQMATQFGAVKGTTLDAAANFGLIAQGAGLSSAAAADLAVSMTRLADDAASFFNTPLDVALEKIRSGLVGEAEPLRAFGVLLSETAVAAKAAEMGFTKVHGQFTESEKVLARVQIITEGLNKAQGDHARTMDSYSNQIKKLTGEWENFKASQGAPIAMAAGSILAAGNKGGLLAGLKEAFFPDQEAMDRRAGVQVGLGAPGPTFAQSERQRQNAMVFAAQDAAWARVMQQQFDAKKFAGGGFGAFGMMGNLGQMMNQQASLASIDAKIARLETPQWGGGHITDPLGFIRQAQEMLLKPQDETAKQQLEELKAIKEAILKSSPDGKPAGMVLRGRES